MRSYENFNLIDFNGYRIEAFCSKAFFPDSESELIDLYNENFGKSLIIIGNGNNVILSKGSYEEPFIIFNGCFDHITINNTDITAEAGATMLQLSETALSHSLSGFEIFFDIPSSVGGAAVMNAGANGEEIKDLLVKVRYLDLEDMMVKELTRNELGFGYRNSFFQKHNDKVVLSASFRLKQDNTDSIKYKMVSAKQKRWETQPRDYPNCGSVFKRPAGRFVGPMLDELGLKGFKIGGAKISEKHSGFIVNDGNATGKEILKLIAVAKKLVRDKFGVDLEVEQRII